MKKIVAAGEMTGLRPKTHGEITREFFNRLRKENPTITLDEAILTFENASFKTLEAFAVARCRTADGYRSVYMPYWER